MINYFKELFKYRELLWNLTRKELKVRYRGSILGIFWSLLNPMIMTLVYTFVFSIVLGSTTKDFPIFLLSGLIPWNFLASSLNVGIDSIVGNSHLINKIKFPREILPLSIIFSNFINFLLELVAFFILLIFMGYKFYKLLYLLPLIILIQIFLVIGATLIVSSVNVYFRDTKHILNIFMLIWFFATPIIYNIGIVPEKFRYLMIVNPMTVFTILYRNIFYYVNYPGSLEFPSFRTLLLCVSLSLAFLLFGYYLFNKLSPRFAEEI
ncbi:MAG: ABC transporter permease [Candidatus Humimicrobiia bacterium]